jgi:hypothetical protein
VYCVPIDVTHFMNKDFRNKHTANQQRFAKMAEKVKSADFGPEDFKDLLLSRIKPELFSDDFIRITAIKSEPDGRQVFQYYYTHRVSQNP